MSERVLNFSEFFGKYSSDKEKSLGDITAASTNFETGFDETTYDQKPIGPNRPEAGASEITPPSPGQAGAPAFSFSQDEEMDAPEETEEAEDAVSQEGEEEDEVEETDEKTEEDDVPEPEAGANPSEKEANESSRFVKGFAQFVNERYEEEEGSWTSDYDEGCPECGEAFDEYGATCGCNM